MTLHLLKLAVGVTDIDDLLRVRAARAAARGGTWVYTRNHPRRAAELLDGGSIYWVVRGRIRVRQQILGFRRERDENGRGYCLIDVDQALVATQTRACRAFQGWRYLPVAAAPPDLRAGEAPMHNEMLAELRALGLI